MPGYSVHCSFFFFTATATTEIYTLSLHDALPIYGLLYEHAAGFLHIIGAGMQQWIECKEGTFREVVSLLRPGNGDRKSTRLNSSHMSISYAVFCLKKKKIQWLMSSAHVQSGTYVN